MKFSIQVDLILVVVKFCVNSELVQGGGGATKTSNFISGFFLKIGSVLRINSYPYVEQYLGEVIPKFHDDMAFASHCKIDFSTGNGTVLSTVSATALVSGFFCGIVRPIVLLVKICQKFPFFSYAKKPIQFQPQNRFL